MRRIEEVQVFAGIVENIGTVVEVSAAVDGSELVLESPIFGETAQGDSIAVCGVCLTAVNPGDSRASFHAASETLRRTTLGELQAGDRVNLERSLRVGERIDGHFVFGHVDSTSQVLSLSTEGETKKFVFSLPRQIAPLIAPKGSVSVSGVSLTVGEVSEDSFSVYVVPYTFKYTTFAQLAPGARVNLEADMLARYVARSIGFSESGVKNGS